MSSLAAAAGRAESGYRLRALGRVAYGDALQLQEELLERRIAAGAGGDILMLEHDPVYTLGRGADEADLMGAPQRLGVPVFRIGRGGGATFHGPGQAVVYPIVGLPGHGRDVVRYIRMLERALITTCRRFAVEARAIPSQTGVWTDRGKIGAIGIGVRRGVAYHGVALNVDNQTHYFDAIVPCRAPGMSVSTLAKELDGSAALPAVGEVGLAIAEAVAEEIGAGPLEVAP